MRCDRAAGPATSEYVMDVGLCIVEGKLLFHFPHALEKGYEIVAMRRE
jgi:hypothetical protein